jgi:ubiquinone/menaquinone biosynthesis C-methylase UbiE
MLSQRQVFVRTSFLDRELSSISQAGLVNNLNDGVAWGLFPLFYAAMGLSLERIGWLAAIYPAVWGVGQLFTGALSDHVGRKWLIVGGMWVQAIGVALIVLSVNFRSFAAGAALLGAGTAMVYPTLLAAIGDVAHPVWRASAVGVYRLWRDLGYAVGALLAGFTDDALGIHSAIWLVAAGTFASGLIVAIRMKETMRMTAPRSGDAPAPYTNILQPEAYRRWYKTPLRARVDADEKEIVFDLADLKPEEQVLDLGCGDGNYTGPAAERAGSAVGLDRSPAMLRAAAKRLSGTPGLRWVEGDAASLPFRDGSFDVVLIVTVLSFAADPQAVVNEAFRVLRSGGRLILGELGRYSSWTLIRRVRGLLGSTTWRNAHFFAPRDLRAFLERAGFTDTIMAAAVFYPPVQHALARSASGAMEWFGRHCCPWAGAFLVMRGRRGTRETSGR